MIVIFDSNYVCHTYKHALSRGLEYNGSPTSVILGFLREILIQAEGNSPDNILFCWDSQERVRRDVLPSYKEKRSNKTEGEKQLDGIAYNQFERLRTSILPALGFRNIFIQDGYESDDIIASIVKNHKDSYLVVSNDEDLYQLLDFCNMHAIKGRTVMTKNLFERQYQISPSQWVDVKAVAGCKSDNVKGIGGVAEKGMLSYLTGELTGNKYHKIKEAMEGEKYKENLKLVSLPYPGTEIPPAVKTNFCSYERFQQVCEEYGLASLMKPENVKKWNNMCKKLRFYRNQNQ